MPKHLSPFLKIINTLGGMCFDSAWPRIDQVLSQYLLNNNDHQLSSIMAGSRMKYSNVTSYMAQTGME